MSLPIVLDKSSFQSLSEKELKILFKYYFVIIPSVLINEIIGDLSKAHKYSISATKVIYLANKFTGMNSAKHVFYKELIERELMGSKIYMDFRPLVKADSPQIDADGKKSVMIKQSPEELAIERWRTGQFSKQEYLYSKEWRIATKTINLDRMKKSLKAIYDSVNSFNTLEDIMDYIDSYFHENSKNFQIIRKIYNEFKISKKYYSKSFQIWGTSKTQNILDIFPYSVYCFKLKMFFDLSLINNLIGTKPTNLIDLEYVYYLPFCRVFSSGDKFHKKILPILINSIQQDFITSEILKEDLIKISEEYLNSNKELPSSPPVSSLISQLYKKLGKNTANKDPLPFENDIEAIVFEKKLNINAPCPCGSGKKLKDCHYEV